MFDLMAAISAYQRGNYRRALSLFQDILTKDPDNAPAHAHLAICLQSMGKPFSAVQEADRALQAGPESSIAHLAKARVSKAVDDLDGAEQAIRESLRLDPENSGALFIRCTVALGERDLEAVRKNAEALLQVTPDEMAPHYFLSRMASLGVDGETAEKHAREALRVAPDEAPAHEAIGWAFWAKRDMEKAREAGLSALAIDPNFQPAHQLLIASEMQSKKMFGWLHRIGMIVSQSSLKKAIIYGAPFFVIYGVALDLTQHYGFKNLSTVINGIVFAMVGLLWYSQSAFSSRSKQNVKEARLKRDY